MHPDRLAAVLALGLVATALAGCRSEDSGPTVSTPTASGSGTATPSASSTAAPTEAPPADPIPGSTIAFGQLIPSVQKAQNTQRTFAFSVKAGDEVAAGAAHCHEPVAWRTKSSRSEEIHVDGKKYERSGYSSGPFRVENDSELRLDGNTPCNPEELVQERDRDGLQLSVLSRSASTDGRHALTQLRGTTTMSRTTYEFWLDASRRPVRIEVTRNGIRQWIVYRDYGAPMTIEAPTDVAPSETAPCGPTSAPGCADPSGRGGSV